MSSNTVSEAVARPVRGAAQYAVALAIVEFIDSVIFDIADRGYQASVVLLALVLSGVQALVENRTGKALLRHVPPKRVPPVDDDQDLAAPDAHGGLLDPMPGRHGWRGDSGRLDVGYVVLIALAVLGVLFILTRL